MKKLILTKIVITTSILFNFVFAQNVGIGEQNPGSKLAVKGGLSVGATYSSLSAPSNGFILQGQMGLGTSSPDSSSALDMSGATKGILLPTMTTTQMNAIANPKKGLMIFNSDSGAFYYYNSKWIEMLIGALGAAGGDLSGSYPNPTVANINGSLLGTTTPTSGKHLIANGTKWQAKSISGDVTMDTGGVATLATSGVSANTYGTATSTPQITVDAKGRITTASNVTISGVAPGGTAGGDLSGSYPNPTVANINGATLGSVTATSGKALIANGTKWQAKSFSGDVTIDSGAVATLATTGVSASTYGTATSAPQITVDAKGRITSASNVTISGVAPAGTAGGDLSGSYPNPTVANINGATLGSVTATSGKALIANGTKWQAKSFSGDVTIDSGAVATLATTGVSASTYGTATSAPQITVDAKGRITSASNVTISGVAPGGTAGGDLSGSYPNPTVIKINGNPLRTTTPTSANILLANGTTWNSKSLAGDVTITDTAGTTAIGASRVVNSMIANTTIDLTAKVTGLLPLANGGTNANLTASNGGIFYSTGTAGAILSGTATANRVLLSGSSTTPAWSTATYPATTTINQLLYSSAANTVAGLATANNGTLITSGAGVPSISSTLPSAVQSNITGLGTVTTGTWNGTTVGVGYGGTGLSSTTVNDLLYSSASNTIGQIATANNGTLITSAAGVPSISSTLPAAVQSNITGLGTVTTGTWNGTLVGVGYGGTGTSTTFTQGSVVYAGASGVYSQDNSNFYWDGTNHRLGIGANSFDATNPEKLLVKAGTTSSVTAIHATGSIDNYFQTNIQNTSSGSSASSDFVATADNGSEAMNYIDLGINGSGNTAAYWGNADDAYLYAHGGNLNIGTDTSTKSIIFLTNGGASSNERMRINGSGNVGIGTATPTSLFSVGSSSQFQVNSTGNIVEINGVATSFPASQGSAGQALVDSDGAGTLRWTTINSSGSSLWTNMKVLASSASAYTVVTNDAFIIVTGTVAQTIYVPTPAAGNAGRILVIRNLSSKAITIETSSGSYMLNIKAANTTAQANLALNSAGGGDAEGDAACIRLVSTGSDWVAW